MTAPFKPHPPPPPACTSLFEMDFKINFSAMEVEEVSFKTINIRVKGFLIQKNVHKTNSLSRLPSKIFISSLSCLCKNRDITC